MDYRNADGSVAEMCGNGIRVFARYLVDEGWAPAGELAGSRPGRREAGPARRRRRRHRRHGPGPSLTGRPHGGVAGAASWPPEVDVGNPHAVAFVDELADAGELREPPVVEPAFPHGVNVEFVEARGPDHVAMRGARARGGRDPVLRHGCVRDHRRRGWTTAEGPRGPAATYVVECPAAGSR